MARKHILRKQRQAFKRDLAWHSLTPEQQIAKLDAQFGVGEGAKAVRAKIAGTYKRKSAWDGMISEMHRSRMKIAVVANKLGVLEQTMLSSEGANFDGGWVKAI